MKDYFASSRQLSMLLAREEGCRVGETAVVSTKVHTLDPTNPATVFIITGRDAGQTFYKRGHAGEIVHIDIFHALARLDPHSLAKAARQGVAMYRHAKLLPVGINLADFIDLQSGLGGGRITGKLIYGQHGSDKRAHENHVHLTLRLSPPDFALVFFVVEQVERAILSLGSELRQVESIVHETSKNHVSYDSMAYSSYSDSFLREQRNMAADATLDNYQHRCLDIADLLEDVDDPLALRELLMLAAPVGRKAALGRRNLPYEATKKLLGYNYWREEQGMYALTESGYELADFLKRCGRQIESDLRPQLRVGRGRGAIVAERWGREKKTFVAKAESAGKTLALVPTLVESLRQTVLEGQKWRVRARHLRYVKPLARGHCDILLLLDASASMLGQRMKASKVLASHLLQVTRDRLGVIYFQENKATLAVPFTRNRSLLREGLGRITPLGLTPLAEGLMQAASYLQQHSRKQESLLVVITDGIPTISQKSGDPVEDAMEVARSIRQEGINLCCIGLLPNQEVLRKLCQVAQGSMYIIDEITPEQLVGIVLTERRAVVREKQE